MDMSMFGMVLIRKDFVRYYIYIYYIPGIVMVLTLDLIDDGDNDYIMTMMMI